MINKQCCDESFRLMKHSRDMGLVNFTPYCCLEEYVNMFKVLWNKFNEAD